MKKLYYISGLTISAFAGLHLINQFCSIPGEESHLEMINTLQFFTAFLTNANPAVALAGLNANAAMPAAIGKRKHCIH